MKNYVMNFSMFENAKHGDLYDEADTDALVKAGLIRPAISMTPKFSGGMMDLPEDMPEEDDPHAWIIEDTEKFETDLQKWVGPNGETVLKAEGETNFDTDWPGFEVKVILSDKTQIDCKVSHDFCGLDRLAVTMPDGKHTDIKPTVEQQYDDCYYDSQDQSSGYARFLDIVMQYQNLWKR